MHPLSDINSVTSKARAISYMLLQITSTFWYMKLHPKVMSASNNSNLNHRKFFIQLSAPAVDAPFLFLRASLSQLHLSMNSSSNVSTAGSETNSKKFSSCHWMRRRHMILTFGLLLIWVLKKCLFFFCVYCGRTVCHLQCLLPNSYGLYGTSRVLLAVDEFRNCLKLGKVQYLWVPLQIEDKLKELTLRYKKTRLGQKQMLYIF